MLRIKQIRIKNFRSIVDLDINVDKMNIFVGLNDAGKSNILKAPQARGQSLQFSSRLIKIRSLH